MVDDRSLGSYDLDHGAVLVPCPNSVQRGESCISSDGINIACLLVVIVFSLAQWHNEPFNLNVHNLA